MLSKYIAITGKGSACCMQEEIDTANLKPNEAVIEAEATMISAGTELSRVFALKQGFSYPVRPGYSAVGRLLAKGSGLVGMEVGDRVYYSGPHASVCRFSDGNRTQGPQIYRLPDGIDPKHGTLITLGLVAMNGVNPVDIKLGDTLVVFGLGTIGILCSLLYQEQGARVIAVDPVKGRCRLAEQMGIKETLDCAPEEQTDRLLKMTGGNGADIVVDVTGAAPAIMTEASVLARNSQFVLLGSPRAPYEADITPFLNALHMKNVRLTGAFNNLYPLHEVEGSRLSVERNFRVICERLRDGRIDAARLISHVIRPEEVEKAYHGLMYDRENYSTVIIDWTL